MAKHRKFVEGDFAYLRWANRPGQLVKIIRVIETPEYGSVLAGTSTGDVWDTNLYVAPHMHAVLVR